MPRGGMAARGPPVGVLRSAAHRRAESRFWGVFIIAVHRAFVLGLGARHRGIVELSEGVIRCVTVFACYSSSSSLLSSGRHAQTYKRWGIDKDGTAYPANTAQCRDLPCPPLDACCR